MKEYILWCDESDKKGKYFSNFYGGALVRSQDLNKVIQTLENKKISLNLFNEVKWQKVTSNYLDKYLDLVNTFFDLIKEDLVKIRIMFTQNCNEPQKLTDYHFENEFQILYYFLIKNAFGFEYSNPANEEISLRLYFDKLPDTYEKNETFKNFIYNLQYNKIFKKTNLKIRKEDVTEVKSHDHVVLQCLDIILGGICFRLNDKHKEKIEGTNRRGKRTIAKEKLYKQILKNIREMYPNFNIGVNTGLKGDLNNRWKHSYRHWLFRSLNSKYNDLRTKQ